MYTFQGYSLKSSHSHLFPQSPKVYSLHMCHPCFPTCRITSQFFQFSHSVVSNSLWPHGCLASLSITNSQSLLKPMSIKSVMPSNHLILCHPLLLPPSVFPSIRVFSNESVLHIIWPKYWNFNFNINTSNEYLGLFGSPSRPRGSEEPSPTSQFKSIDSSLLSFLMGQLSDAHMTTGENIALTR